VNQPGPWGEVPSPKGDSLLTPAFPALTCGANVWRRFATQLWPSYELRFCQRATLSFAPTGLSTMLHLPHGLRRGLHPCAASRLNFWFLSGPIYPKLSKTRFVRALQNPICPNSPKPLFPEWAKAPTFKHKQEPQPRRKQSFDLFELSKTRFLLLSKTPFVQALQCPICQSFSTAIYPSFPGPKCPSFSSLTARALVFHSLVSRMSKGPDVQAQARAPTASQAILEIRLPC
jgi:hypothetical protein